MAVSCDFCVVYIFKLYIKGSTHSCQETSQSLTLIQWSPPKKNMKNNITIISVITLGVDRGFSMGDWLG